MKKYAFIQDERLGKIYFPLEAARVTGVCSDLRERFSVSFVFVVALDGFVIVALVDSECVHHKILLLHLH